MQILLRFILSFFILIQSLGISGNSLFQLDDLWTHYLIHKAENGDSFLTFLDLHYGSKSKEHQDEHPEHQNLPLQTSSQIHYTYIVKVKDFNFDFLYPSKYIQHNFGYSVSFNSLLGTDILQPPKHLA